MRAFQDAYTSCPYYLFFANVVMDGGKKTTVYKYLLRDPW